MARKGLATLLANGVNPMPGSCDCGESRPPLRIAAPPPAIVKQLDPGTLGLVALAASAQASYAAGCGCDGGGASGGGGPRSLRDYADIESDLKLNPVMTLGRWLRAYILGGVVANNIVTFNTQRTFLPFKLVTGSPFSGTIARLQSGVHQYFATTDPIPLELFAFGNFDTNYLRPLVCEVGEKITGLIGGTAPDAMALIGFDLDDQCMCARRKGALMPLGFSQTFATASTATITLQTQKAMRVRRLAFDHSQSGIAGTIVNSFFIGNEPQFESADGVPIEVFLDNGPNMFIDGDILKVGATATINCTVPANAGASTVLQGFLEGDTGY